VEPDFTVDIGKLHLKNPLLLASGIFGYADEMENLSGFSFEEFGGLILKGTTYLPREGNPPPRIVTTPSGMLNSIGLQNVGVHGLVNDILPRIRHLNTALIANISGSTVEEYRQVASVIRDHPDLAGIELNISCPNVKEGGAIFGCTPCMAAEVTTAVRKETHLPLIVKLAPHAASIVDVARACQDAGADAFTCINTIPGMAIDIHSHRPRLATNTGGLSGPAIKPVAIWKVVEVSQAVSVPVIGSGGIWDWEDAVEFAIAGAIGLQIGTVWFVDYKIGTKILEGLKDYLKSKGHQSYREIVGTVKLF